MIVYAATHRESGKTYVGITRQSLQVRIKRHLHPSLCRYAFQRALRKYGVDAFYIRIIDTASSFDELCTKEREWIASLNTVAPNGYNLTAGGEGVEDPTGEIARKISASRTGQKLSPEHRAASSKGWFGSDRKPWNHGRKLSPEHRLKLSQAKRPPRTAEAIAKGAAKQMGHAPTRVNATRNNKGQFVKELSCPQD